MPDRRVILALLAHDPDSSGVHRRDDRGIARGGPPRSRDAVDRRLGGDQHDVARPRDHQVAAPAGSVRLGPQPHGDDHRHRRRDDVAGRGLAVLHPRPQHRARRHDGPPVSRRRRWRRARRWHGRRRCGRVVPTKPSSGPTAASRPTGRPRSSCLLDRWFPRSVVVVTRTGRTRRSRRCATVGPRSGFSDEALRLLGRARTELEYRPLDELVFDLPVEMERLQRSCAAATDAIAARYFAAHEFYAWTGGVVL